MYTNVWVGGGMWLRIMAPFMVINSLTHMLALIYHTHIVTHTLSHYHTHSCLTHFAVSNQQCLTKWSLWLVT